MSFVRRVIQSSGSQLAFFTGKDAIGFPFWCYMRLKKQASVQEKMESISLTDCGQVLHKGYGKCPPRYIQDIMRLEYGFDPVN